MAKIYELSTSYVLVRSYVTFTFRNFYSKFIVVNKENIPQQGPAILGPNHLNALMDALALLSSLRIKQSIVYLARADVFGSELARKGLRFVKILPAFRMRDGIENLGKNNETFDMAQETLVKKNLLGIMPEGAQGKERKLRPLAKGIFRIAFSTQEKLGDSDSVKLIPVGLDYSDWVDFGGELIINYGTPIDMSEYMELYQENQAVATNRVRDRYYDELHSRTVDMATDKYYKCFETAVEVCNTGSAKTLYSSNDTISRFYARQKLSNHLVEIEKEKPETIEELDKTCEEYRKLRKKTKLKTETLEKPAGFGKKLLHTLLLLVTLPVFVSGFLLNVLPFFLPPFIRKQMKVKDKGFFSSFDYFLGALITFPLFYIIQTALLAIFMPLPWWIFPLYIPMTYWLGKLAFKWYKSCRKLLQQYRYGFLKIKNKSKIKKLQELREKIILLTGKPAM